MNLSIPDSLPVTLQAAVARRKLSAGQVLFHQGDPAQAMFVVERGRLRLDRNTREGKTTVFQVARVGESFAESALFFEVYSCDAIAEIPSRLLVYPKQLLRTALHNHPALAEDFIERLLRKSQSLKIRLELRSLRSARDRVLHYLLVEAQPGETTVRFDRSLKEVAGDLGLTPEVFYRTLSRLEREGTITRTKGQITFHPSVA